MVMPSIHYLLLKTVTEVCARAASKDARVTSERAKSALLDKTEGTVLCMPASSTDDPIVFPQRDGCSCVTVPI